MSARHSATLGVVVACLVVLTTGGAALARTPAQPTTSSATAPLYNRVLQFGDLPGFWSVTCPVAVTSAAQWSLYSSPAATLSSNGFVNGLREPLRASHTASNGWSVVAQFRSATGARHEALGELARATGSGADFAGFEIAAIPGSHGYSLADGRSSRMSVGFTEGRFQYLITIAGVDRSDASLLRARLVTAATTLYERAEQHR
jgi:hypothetical protein